MKYTLFWRTGEAQLVEGDDPADAMNAAGIGAGALPALDFWQPGDAREEHKWNTDTREWVAEGEQEDE